MAKSKVRDVVISFRLNKSERAWLKLQCEDGESPNEAARRLLLEVKRPPIIDALLKAGDTAGGTVSGSGAKAAHGSQGR